MTSMNGVGGGGNRSSTGGGYRGGQDDAQIVDVVGGVCAVPGVQAAGVAAGLKPSGAPDVAIVDAGSVVDAAVVQTRNQVRAAPVELTARHARDGKARAVLLNAGSANACTGPDGLALAGRSAQRAADAIGCRPTDILVCSTGVIGQPIPEMPFLAGIDAAAAALGPAGDEGVARAIMTTDLVSKQVAVEVSDDSGACRIGGTAKGSGMIRPDMATMLCVVTTDAPVAAPELSAMLRSAVDGSFNRISIDGCMSTNDAVIVLATGSAEQPPGMSTLEEGLRSVLCRLAEMVVRDGEGASRIARIRVSGARSIEDAVGVGRQVADSALVRTALAGGDPNWGRILAAMGAGPVRFSPEKVSVTMGRPGRPGITVCRFGVAASFDRGQASAAVSGDEVIIGIDLGAGDAVGEVLTCDLTHEYITINAEYTT